MHQQDNLKSLSPGISEWTPTQTMSNDFSSIFSSGNTTPAHHSNINHNNGFHHHQQQQQTTNHHHQSMFTVASGGGLVGGGGTSLLNASTGPTTTTTTTTNTSASAYHHHHHDPRRTSLSSGGTPTQSLPVPSSTSSTTTSAFPIPAARSATAAATSAGGTHQQQQHHQTSASTSFPPHSQQYHHHHLGGYQQPTPPTIGGYSSTTSASAPSSTSLHHHHQSNHVQHQHHHSHPHHHSSTSNHPTNPNYLQGNDYPRHGYRHHHNNENIDGVACLGYNELSNQTVDHLGRCTITDIRAENFIENECYHSEVQRDTIVTARAHVHQTNTVHKIQRIMVGQLWMDFVRDAGLTDGHSVGRLMAFIANEPITIFGMIPNDALKNGQSKTVPTMVGFWLSIDSKDHPEGLLDLQRASILFSRKGLLAAFTPAEHRRLLEIADARRTAGNTGLPESPMTLEAAKNPPKRQSTDGKEVDVFRYHPPAHHRWPQTRGGFHPFVTRWEMSMKEDELSRFGDEKSFSLVATEMKNLRPWGKRVISKLKMVRRNDSDDDIPIHSLNEEEQYE